MSQVEMETRPELISREEFLEERWRYQAGEHVTLLGPTGSGKTMLQMQLLQKTAKPELPAIVMAVKPRDSTMKKWEKTLRYRVVRDWPPPFTGGFPGAKKPSGWIVWPRHSFDPDKDNKKMHDVFRKVILDAYRKGNRILVADEAYGVAANEELKLGNELVTVWSRGRSMGCGLWVGTQKPTHIPLWAYNQASHIFAAHDPDKRSRERFQEIGGIDPELMGETVLNLKRHQFLYVRRDGPRTAIIDR